MIATRRRDKTSRNLSYPVGAETIVKALASVPRLSALSLSFVNLGRLSRAYLQRLDGGGVLPVAGATYGGLIAERLVSCPDQTPQAPNVEIWEVVALALPRSLRAQARLVAQDRVLPALAVWLTVERHETWFHKPQSVFFFWNVASGEIDARSNPFSEASGQLVATPGWWE